ncbi:MAG: hypothetical protein ABII71_02570 [Candidatus Micrarchaeota archaeon]
MKPSIKTGFSFGLTSAIITTLGLMVGLNAGTHSPLAVIGGVITIAIADALSDSLGIHVSTEAQNKYSQAEVWEATASTFATKFVFGLSFVIPLMLFELQEAMVVAIIWGLALLAAFSYVIAKEQKVTAWHVVAEHLAIAIVVIVLGNFVGEWVAVAFS